MGSAWSLIGAWGGDSYVGSDLHLDSGICMGGGMDRDQEAVTLPERVAICLKCRHLVWVQRQRTRCRRCALAGCCEDWQDRLRHGACPAEKWE